MMVQCRTAKKRKGKKKKEDEEGFTAGDDSREEEELATAHACGMKPSQTGRAESTHEPLSRPEATT